MGNLTNALQELRAERKQAQARVENLDQAISVIELLNGLGTFKMGEGSSEITTNGGSENNWSGSCEAHPVSSSP
jgi:hypothetical protein